MMNGFCHLRSLVIFSLVRFASQNMSSVFPVKAPTGPGLLSVRTSSPHLKSNAGELVATKMVCLDIIPPRDRQRHKQELTLLKRMSHPHVTAYKDSWIDRAQETHVVLVMELCVGATLPRASSSRLCMGIRSLWGR